jgi:DNA (cytosine-5)-methyltransferase 1
MDDQQEPAGKLIPSRIEHIRPHVRTRTFWKKGKAFAGDVSYYGEEDEDEETTENNQPTLFDELVSR